MDYSALTPGAKLQAEVDGVWYSAEVVTVSTGKSRAKAPVKVHFAGYTAADDIWVGAARLRSKLLKEKKEAKKPETAKKGKKKVEKPKLEVEMGYWAIRGLGAPIRMILEYKGVTYTDNQYADGQKWFAEDKPKLLEKNPLANLPYVKEGDTVICQSNSVLSYLGMRLGLAGRDPTTRFKNEQLLCEIFDTRNAMIELVYPFKKVNRTEAEFKESAPNAAAGNFGKYEAWLDMYKTDYFCGPKPLVCDFHIWEMLDQTKLLAEKIGEKTWFEKFPLCKAFYDRFKALEPLQKYFESPAYKLPCNNIAMAGAYFG